MNPVTIGYLLQALTAIPQLVTAGQSVVALINSSSSIIAEKREPTDAEWELLNGTIILLRKQLHS